MQFPSILSAALLALSVQLVAGAVVPAPAPAPVQAQAPAPTTASTDCPAIIAQCLKPNGDASFNPQGCADSYKKLYETCAHGSLCKSAQDTTCVKGLVTDFNNKGKNSPIIECICKK